MRTVPASMWGLWSRGGPFFGSEGAPHGRVTVEKDWLLNTEGGVTTSDPRKLPFRWFQRIDNSQVETEVPNIKTIQIDRSLDNDAATLSITLYNTTMSANQAGTNRQLGKPGHYTWEQPSRAARARWNAIKGPWSDVLIPNALLRTYQGFGGKEKSLATALEDGNVILTGLWLIDEVRPGTNGLLEIRCRDMGKLLIEQQLYPPLIPFGMYPLRYERWHDTWVRTPPIPEYDITNPKKQSPGPLEGPKYASDIAMSADGKGYWILGSDGGVFSYRVPFYGSRGGGQNPVEHHDNAPMVAMIADPLNRGYWLAGADGGVFTFGETLTFEGSLGDHPINEPITNMAAHPSGRGYWLVGRDGGVFCFGVAGFFGSQPGTNGHPIVDIAATPSGNGYYLLDDRGGVYTYGDASFHGSAVGEVPANPDIWNRICGMAVRPQGDGYWLLRGNGDIYAYGGAQYLNHRPNGDWVKNKANMQDPMMDLVATSTGDGYLMVGGDGGVFSFGDAPFWGSLPGAFQYLVREEGNYKDYTDIIRDLLLWSGWLAYGTGKDDVYGNLETTGAYAEWPLGADMFDKKPVIDGINQLKEIVGYHFWIDDEGAARFESPNWFIPGNYMEDGTHVQVIPEIDEKLQLTDYAVSFTDRDMRSEIIISSYDPLEKDHSDTIVSRARIDTPGLDLLRGMVRPGMWVNQSFKNSTEAERMAELIAMHAARSLRMGNVTCVANPAIQINDQVRLQERNTKDSYVHYVRGLSTTMDLDAGTYLMTLTTNWMTQDWGDSA